MVERSASWSPFPVDRPLPQVPAFATRAPGRAAGAVEVDGIPQAAAWDLAERRYRVCTDAPHGVDLCEIEPDGRQVWWFDTDGEAGPGTGRWSRQPFGGGDVGDALPGTPPGRMYGVAFDRDGRTAAVAVGVNGTTRVHAGPPGGPGGEVLVAEGYLGLVDLAPDGSLLVLAGRPDGPGAVCLCALSSRSSRRGVEWLGGGYGRRLWPLEFRPTGPPELLLAIERLDGFALATWQPGRGLRVYERPLFDTEISARWLGSGRGVLVQQDRHGRSRLHRVGLDAGLRVPLPTPDGTILDLALAPDGRVYRLWTNAEVPPTVLDSTLDSGSGPADGLGPVGRPEPGAASARGVVRSERWTEQPYGAVHTFLATPPGTGPWPAMFLVHGGPGTHDRDCYDPRVEVLTAAGFAVARVNYRGSTGYGARWRRGFGHRVGLAQLEDLAAVRRDLVAAGVVDPERVGLSGYSWGGYLALLGMGVQPGEWALAMAAFPIADYPAAHRATTPALREVDVELFGGTPDEVPQRYRDASPMSYVDNVCGPVLLVSSRTDERCPAEQVQRYATALAGRGVRCELAWVGGGHHSRDSADHASVMDRMLRFATDVLPPVPGRTRGRSPSVTTAGKEVTHEATQRAQRPDPQR
ncbi:hypothetical protein BU204_17595 [Actinophytocola xanthii]|uniref:Peptidase S9 prolyl oligopeptidase catalytic domain-containing protein n=1 Tax=Actinophytocola xanthii TaxID=1912961 RepID=A0A1Q8CPA6_9PSEU|nr:hypothetical protein BU204_17595 [Actinophytocola xanthii]